MSHQSPPRASLLQRWALVGATIALVAIASTISIAAERIGVGELAADGRERRLATAEPSSHAMAGPPVAAVAIVSP